MLAAYLEWYMGGIAQSYVLDENLTFPAPQLGYIDPVE